MYFLLKFPIFDEVSLYCTRATWLILVQLFDALKMMQPRWTKDMKIYVIGPCLMVHKDWFFTTSLRCAQIRLWPRDRGYASTLWMNWSFCSPWIDFLVLSCMAYYNIRMQILQDFSKALPDTNRYFPNQQI